MISHKQARIDRLFSDAARQVVAGRVTQGLLIVLFLAWWIPTSLAGVLAWWAHPWLWLGLLFLCSAAQVPARTLISKAERLQKEPDDGAQQDPNNN